MPPRRSARKTSGPVVRSSSKVVKPATVKKPAPKSRAASKASMKKTGKAAASKKGKEDARSLTTEDEDPMDIDADSNSRWLMDKENYGKFVDYSVLAAYAAGTNIEKPPRGERQPRWTHEGDEPLTNSSELPEGWNTHEPDLLEDEIDEQIERCHQRIADNIFPAFFEIRLQSYLERKKKRKEMIASEPAGLDLQTVERLVSLRAIEASLTESDDADVYGQLPNIRALMKAYRNKELMFIRGMITYWSKGVLIGPPEPFDHKRHEAFLAQYETHREFWVEGFLGAGSPQQMVFSVIGPTNSYYSHEIFTEMRTAGASLNCAPLGQSLLYDTGAEIMSINQQDVDQMQAMSGLEPPTFGHSQLVTGNGVVSRRVVEIEVSIRDHNWAVMCPFVKVLAAVNPDNTAERLTGPWMKFVLFTATSPGANNLYLTDNKAELVYRLPAWTTGAAAGTGP
ncbi:hypothetical protein N7467_009783 [Penicillium canescens]|nr:hypothetical protein N7467_009783 [Penicillium canescens]